MSWLAIVIIAYFILSVSNILDKIFLSKVVTESIVYAIWVSAVSVIIAGVVLHVVGALKHHVIDKDSTLKRMLGAEVNS